MIKISIVALNDFIKLIKEKDTGKCIPSVKVFYQTEGPGCLQVPNGYKIVMFFVSDNIIYKHTTTRRVTNKNITWDQFAVETKEDVLKLLSPVEKTFMLINAELEG